MNSTWSSARVTAAGDSNASSHWHHGGTADTGPSLCEKSRVYATVRNSKPNAIAINDITFAASSALRKNVTARNARQIIVKPYRKNRRKRMTTLQLTKKDDIQHMTVMSAVTAVMIATYKISQDNLPTYTPYIHCIHTIYTYTPYIHCIHTVYTVPTLRNKFEVLAQGDYSRWQKQTERGSTSVEIWRLTIYRESGHVQAASYLQVNDNSLFTARH